MTVGGYIIKAIAAHPGTSMGVGMIMAATNADGVVEVAEGIITQGSVSGLIMAIGGAVAAIMGGVAAIMNAWANIKHGRSDKKSK